MNARSFLAVSLFTAPFTALVAAQSAPLRTLHTHVPPDTSIVRDLATGDVDGDGDVDLIQLGDLHVLFNDGLARFEAGPPLGFFGEPDARLATADVDGDGDLDLGFGGDPAELLLGDGAGGFAPGGVFPAAPVRQQLAFGDLDADGDVDAFLAGYGDRRVLQNDGSGAFALSHPPLGTLSYVYFARLADVDGDGDLDAFVGNRGSFGATDSLYANDGTGLLSDVSGQLVSVDASTAGGDFADLDGDGDLDLTVKYDLGPLRSYLNDGGGVFSTAPGQPSDTEQFGGDLALGDLSGDGTPDVVVAALSGIVAANGQSRLYFGDGAGGWIDATHELPQLSSEDTLSIDLADLDGDGDLDLVTGALAQQTRVLLGDGERHFRDVTASLPPTAGSTTSLAVGDVDGDGRPDLMVGTGYGQDQRLLLGRDDGTWTDASENLPAKAETVVRTLLGDLDGDGDLDGVWVEDSFLGVTRALWNDGTGAFTQLGISLTADATDGELADLDGDGDLDVVVSAMGDFSHTVLNNGDGSFAPTSTPFSALDIMAIDVGDLNGDGFVDVWAGLWFAPQRVWVGDGAGGMTFWKQPAPGISHATADVALADFDADGDLDTAVSGSQSSLYRKSGATWTTEPLAATGALTTADFDFDGDVDLLASGLADGLLRNDGTGAFTQEPLWSAGTLATVGPLVVYDLDGDGDLDAVAASSQDRVLWNVERQLAWRRLPDAGEPLTLDLYGDASSPWFLAWSPATASLPVAPYGTLRLDPTGLQTLGFGALDGSGEDTFEVLIPANPTLIGAKVFAQALVGAPLRFTNLESVPISGF